MKRSGIRDDWCPETPLNGLRELMENKACVLTVEVLQRLSNLVGQVLDQFQAGHGVEKDCIPYQKNFLGLPTSMGNGFGKEIEDDNTQDDEQQPEDRRNIQGLAIKHPRY
jgi:hypothetical protein